MADRIRKIDYFYTTIPNRPGEGARVLEQLHGEGVDFQAFHAFPTGGESQIDLVPSDAGALRRAAESLGLDLTGPKTVFLIEGEDRPGAGAALLGRLAEAKINVTALDAVVVGDRYGSLLWVKPEAVDDAAKALGAS
jgi:hypothetical protein